MDLKGPVVVTGAGGLLGREITRALAARDVEACGLSRRELDVTDRSAVREALRRIRPAAVVHCAAITSVDGCEEEPESAFAVNAQGSGNVGRAAREADADLLAVSTDYVFDGRKGAPYTEEDKPNPIQVYGRTKLAGEEQVRWTGEEHYIVRSAWIYGEGGKSFLSRLPEIAGSGNTIRAVADQIGSPTYAPDLAEAIVRLLGSGRYGTYHVSNEGSCTFAAFCRHALRAAGLDAGIEEVSRRDLGLSAPRPASTALDDVAWTDAGFAPLRPWEDAARAFIDSATRS